MIQKYSFGSLEAASIDRIEQSRGYELDNVQLVCKWANFAKNKYKNEDLKQILAKVRAQETEPMSFETIKIARQLPVINGQVILPEKLPPASNPNSSSGCRGGGIPLQTFLNLVNGTTADAAEVTGAYGAGNIIGGVALGTAAIVQLPQGGNSGRSGGSRGKQTFIEFVDPVVQSNSTVNIAIASLALTASGTPILPVNISSATATTTGTNPNTSTVTITTTTAHGFLAKQQVVISNCGAGYNGAFTITAVTTNTFTYTVPVIGLAAAYGGIAAVQTMTITSQNVDLEAPSTDTGMAAIESAKTYFNANLAADTNSSATVNGVAGGMPSNTDLGR